MHACNIYEKYILWLFWISNKWLIPAHSHRHALQKHWGFGVQYSGFTVSVFQLTMHVWFVYWIFWRLSDFERNAVVYDFQICNSHSCKQMNCILPNDQQDYKHLCSDYLTVIPSQRNYTISHMALGLRIAPSKRLHDFIVYLLCYIPSHAGQQHTSNWEIPQGDYVGGWYSHQRGEVFCLSLFACACRTAVFFSTAIISLR